MHTPEVIADFGCEIGENPLWHPVEQRLYWIDIPTGRLFRYDPQTEQHEQFHLGEPCGGFTFQRDGGLLLFMTRGAVKTWKDGETQPVIAEIAEERDTRFNDVIADSEGRVFCGTLATREHPGRLYRLDTDGTLHRVVDGIRCSNGLAFTPDATGLYYADTFPRLIYRFDYERSTGELSNQQVFAAIAEGEGMPDGLTVDADGYMWCARWDGSCLVRYAPDGTEERRILFPVRKVSSVIFGGADHRDMYVTTAGGTRKDRDGEMAGALFRLRLGIQGLVENFSNVKTSR